MSNIEENAEWEKFNKDMDKLETTIPLTLFEEEFNRAIDASNNKSEEFSFEKFRKRIYKRINMPIIKDGEVCDFTKDGQPHPMPMTNKPVTEVMKDVTGVLPITNIVEVKDAVSCQCTNGDITCTTTNGNKGTNGFEHIVNGTQLTPPYAAEMPNHVSIPMIQTAPERWTDPVITYTPFSYIKDTEEEPHTCCGDKLEDIKNRVKSRLEAYRALCNVEDSPEVTAWIRALEWINGIISE